MLLLHGFPSSSRMFRDLIPRLSDAYHLIAPDVRAGAGGFLVKDTEPDDLLAAVRTLAHGDALLSLSVTKRLIAEFASRSKPPPQPPGLDELTDREREILALVGSGLSNDEIATGSS